MANNNIQQQLTQRASNPELLGTLIVLDLVNSDHIVSICENLLAAGYDSHSLRILAGQNNPIASDWLPLFKKAMAELKVQIPSETEAAKIVARAIATMIIDKELTPREGAQAMWDTLHLIEGFAPKITIFEELAWALDSGSDQKPFPEMSQEQIECRIMEEARQIATTE